MATSDRDHFTQSPQRSSRVSRRGPLAVRFGSSIQEGPPTHKRPLASASLVIGGPSRSMPRNARPTGDVLLILDIRRLCPL